MKNLFCLAALACFSFVGCAAETTPVVKDAAPATPDAAAPAAPATGDAAAPATEAPK